MASGAKGRVTVTKDFTDRVLREIASLSKKRVLVGIPADTTVRDPDPEEPQPPTNAMIGYVMETGSPARNIPARPHLVPGVENVKEEIIARYKAGSKAVLDGQQNDLDSTHTAVGLTAQASVQRKIDEGPFEPLAESTLAERRRRGRTGEKPLIDTGQYRRAITYVVREQRK